MSFIRTRWAAVGAAIAVTLGGGGVAMVSATTPGDATTFVPITPCRVIDTRPEFQVGPKDTPLGPGATHTVTVHGDNGECTGIPDTATAVSLNVTAVGATAETFLTVWATGQTQPNASSLNPAPGQPPTPNAVTTNVSSTGRFDVYNLAGNVDVLADVNGYYVDHDHDDRYYTEDEVDAALGLTKFVNLQTFRDVESIQANRPFGGPTSDFVTSLVLPPDYTSGTDLVLRLHVFRRHLSANAACTLDLDVGAVFMLRPATGGNLDDDGGPIGDGVSGDGTASFDPVLDDLATLDFVISQPGTIPLRPGDSVSIELFRAGTTCVISELGVHSAALYYE